MAKYRKYLYKQLQDSYKHNYQVMRINNGPKGINPQEYIERIKNHGDWHNEITDDSTDIPVETFSLIANSLWAQGYDKEAYDFITYYRNNYREKDITARIDKATNEVLVNFTLRSRNPSNPALKEAFRDNVKSVVTKFHYEQQLLHEQSVRTQRVMLTAVIAVSAAVIISLCLYLRIISMRRRRKEDDYMRTAAELKTSLTNLEDMHIRTLSNLCNTYYDSYSSSPAKSRIAREALATINEIAGSDSFLATLETHLNESACNLMTHLRNEIPDLKESDLKLYICNAIGLSIPAICLTLNEKRDVIYTRRLRLRAKIQDADTPHKDQFLNYLR